MIWFALSVIVLIALAVWRRYHHKYAELKFKYKIYDLRDQLRMLAIKEDINSETWVFDYFDDSFSKAISSSYYITLLRLSILSVLHEKDQELEEFSQKLELELSKVTELKSLQSDYLAAVKSYIIDQHYVSINFIVKPLVVLIFGATVAAYKLNQWLKGILVYPETSASDQFAYSYSKR